MERMLKISLILAVLFAGCLLTAGVRAETICVGSSGYPYDSIQAAIDDADDGDIVLVHDGTYVENINFSGKAITVKSVNGADNTIIDGNGTDSVVTFDSGETHESVIDGFTITNGHSSTGMGGGIYCNSSYPTISNCTITENFADLGGGIDCENSNPATMTINNCIISKNTALICGGIHCKISIANITNCTISENTGTWVSGGVGLDWGSTAVITNCVITGNTGGNGGGIYGYTSSLTMTNSTITGNTATNGGGIYGDTNLSATITNCIITGNTATNDGGGIYANNPSTTITNCTISRNTANNQGGGVLLNSTPSFTVKNTILWGNESTVLWVDSSEIYFVGNCFCSTTYCDINSIWGEDYSSGNIRLDPQFVDPENGDFRLQMTSPCIDAGDNSVLTSISTDFEGDDRPVNGGKSSTVDIGADEFSWLVSPANGAVCKTCTLIKKNQPVFQWLSDGDFKSFTIVFSTSPTDFSTKGVSIAKGKIKLNQSSYIPSIATWKKLLPASNNKGDIREVYWKVIGTRTGNSTWESGVRHFRVDDPYAVVIQSPDNDTSLSSQTAPTFTFDTNCNTKFTLEFSALEGFSNPKLIKKFKYSSKDPNTETTKVVTLSLSRWKNIVKLVGIGSKGYFRVTAKDGLSRETISETISFTIQ
ncbi:exported hypothetical protein [uncultured Desulfobacterium sp.]|uniref:Right handed beta helix domain-containing protein n=1 Tax=uncultured Desulfobacterium sp. TaxID=201089 RepID=A0A445MV26_9BACT|nr:exported hypothetical protein [uncultured Desulfobacterium sp.]